MKCLKAIAAAGSVCAVLVAGYLMGNTEPDVSGSIPNVVTADIQAGIEKYIEEQANHGGGYFRFSSDGKEYLFKLVRVHTEYLANLGPRRHFACVDLVATSGDVYDVDFFLSGDPGTMTVTETTLHKLNGIPSYVWEQNKKGTWQRVPIKGASPKLLGLIRGIDEFEFLYRVKLPAITDTARMWIPLPASDAFQTVDIKSINAPENRRVLKDSRYGNKVLFFELGTEDSEKTVDIRYQVQRIEKASYVTQSDDPEEYLKSDSLIPVNDKFRDIAEGVVHGKKGDLVRARALYDHVIERLRYIKVGSDWGKGDAVYACDAGTGNCTEYHSYFIALARTIDIPARFAIGASIPSERNDGGVDGYHCWAEFYAEGKWWPVDISEADKYSSLSTYYFGHHPANRFEFSRGRDLVVEPAPASGPINFLAYPVLEMGGKPVEVKVEFSFNRNVARRQQPT
ncbi:MAG: transglutaminase domain-containing protein [Candidatus Omnitrophica bacterium]|nr:transglutaminase domain-containing protein [Candidatus Omnitrophota bacterium]